MSIEVSAFVLRRNWVPIFGMGALAVLGLVATQLVPGAESIFGYLAAWCGIMFGLTFHARNSFQLTTRTRIEASATTLHVEGYAHVANADVVEARVLPRGVDAVVELGLRDGGALTLRMGVPEAKALCDLLGARRSRFRLVMPFAKRYVATVAVLAIVFLVATGNVYAWLAMMPASFIYALVIAWLAGYVRGGLVVGADGITTRFLFLERFVPFRDVASVTGHSNFGGGGTVDTIVKLKSGRTSRLRTVEAPNGEEDRAAEGHALLAHVLEAFTRSGQLALGGAEVRMLLQRGALSAREWLSALDALLRGGGSRYRVAAVSPEMLADLTNDPTATVEARVGAAAALVRMNDDELRVRVRVAAAGCAESELREALLALADARDDVATEVALASLRR